MKLAVRTDDLPPRYDTPVPVPTGRELFLDGDVLLAEASAHLVTAYRNMEALSLLAPPVVTTRSFTLAIRSLYLALIALDECSDVVWGVGPPPSSEPSPEDSLAFCTSGRPQ